MLPDSMTLIFSASHFLTKVSGELEKGSYDPQECGLWTFIMIILKTLFLFQYKCILCVGGKD